jgi:hypothetical protein
VLKEENKDDERMTRFLGMAHDFLRLPTLYNFHARRHKKHGLANNESFE